MLTERDLLYNLITKTGYTGYILFFKKEYNEKCWGNYYKQNKVIILYTLDENGDTYDDQTLIRVACHELAHHVQYNLTEGYDADLGEEHDEVFKGIFAKILDKYYNGKVPKEIIDFVREEGLLDESKYVQSKKKRWSNNRCRHNIHE
jgi:hypothetical protein